MSNKKSIRTLLNCLKKVNSRKIAKQMSYSPIPAWELMKADFKINYTDMKKKKRKKKIPIFCHFYSDLTLLTTIQSFEICTDQY